MGYPEERLADNPALYLRLDVEGGGVDGETVPDSSGNDLHGELEYIGGPTPWGIPSPIETDIDSTAFYGHNIPFSDAARISVPHDDLISPAGDFALAGWMRVLAPGASHAPQMYFGKGTGNPFFTNCFFLGTDIFNALFVGGMWDSAGTLWTVTDAVSSGGPDALIDGNWHDLWLVRVANTLALYVDKQLCGTTTITSGLPTLQTSDPFFVHCPQTSDMSALYDEVALYTHSVNGTRIGIQYDAAKLVLSLNGYSNVIPSAILYSDLEPAPVEFPFRHNWDDPLIERISFRTNQAVARKGYSENAITRPKPRREIEISQVLRDNSERSRLRSQLTAQQNRKWFIPILQDREQLTTTLASGSTTIPVITQYKDYEVDSWAELRQLNALGQVVKSEVVEISAVNANDIQTTPTVNSYDAFLSIVGPARRALIGNSQSLRGHSGEVEETTILARLIAEDEKVTPNRIIPWTPTLTYKEYEVFDPTEWQSNDWSELRDYDVTRAQETVDFDSGSFVDESDALAAVEVFSYRILLETREQQAALLGWFYARAGAAQYLWVPTMQADFEIVSAAGSNLTVAGHNHSNNFSGSEFRRDLAFVYNDNAMILRRISSVTVAGANEVLALDSSVPTTTNLRSVSYLRFCQLDNDTLEIAREADTKARFAWAFRELLVSPD